MPWLLSLLSASDQFIVFTMVLVRTSGLMLATPVFGTSEVPVQVRALLALALALLIAPAQLAAASLQAPATLPALLVLVAGELLVGLALGLAITILVSGVQLAGQIIGQTSGLALADVFNPTLDTSIPLFSQFLHMLALAIYLLIGGHRLLMGGLLETFAAIPPGHATAAVDLASICTSLLTESFSLGLRVAAPATLALLLATLVMGLVTRTLPQLNILVFGFGLNVLATFGVLALSLGSLAWVLQDQFEPAVSAMLDALAVAAPPP